MLVTGAAGMVGGMAAQLARARGAQVVAVVRDSDAAQARSLGAEATVSTGNGLADELRQGWPDGFDACLDTIGLQSALAGVRDGGAYVTTQPTGVPPAERGISAQAVQVQPDGSGARAARRTGRRREASPSGSPPRFRWPNSAAVMTSWPGAASAARWSS